MNPKECMFNIMRDSDHPDTKAHCDITGEICNIEIGEPCPIYEDDGPGSYQNWCEAFRGANPFA